MAITFGRRGPKPVRIAVIQYRDSGASFLCKHGFQGSKALQIQNRFVYYELNADIVSVPELSKNVAEQNQDIVDKVDGFIFIYDATVNASASFTERAIRDIAVHKETTRFPIVVVHCSRLSTRRRDKVPISFGHALAFEYGGEFAVMEDNDPLIGQTSRQILELALDEVCSLRMIEKQIRARLLEDMQRKENGSEGDSVTDVAIINVVILFLIVVIALLPLLRRTQGDSAEDDTVEDLL